MAPLRLEDGALKRRFEACVAPRVPGWDASRRPFYGESSYLCFGRHHVRGLWGFWAFGLLKCVINSRLEPVAQQSKYAVSDERCFVDHLDLPGCGHGRDYVYVCLEVVYVKPLLRFPC